MQKKFILWVLASTFLLHLNLKAQPFSDFIDISKSISDPQAVRASDLDGDGDLDILSASGGNDKIAWYENLGAGSFSSENIISTNANGAASVYASDLDGDGDMDILSASTNDGKIAWYENTRINITTFMAESPSDNHINLYPNPSSTIITVDLGKDPNEVSLQVLDIMGKEVLAIQKLSKRKFTLSTNQLSPGMYFVKIRSIESLETFSFIKE